MLTPQNLELASALLVPIATVPYVCGILRQENPTRPALPTWIVWTALALLIVSSGDFSWQMVSILVCDIVILALAFVYGERRWTSIDLSCLALGVLALMARALDEGPAFTLGFSLLAISISSVPTFIHVYKFPETEKWLPWSGMALSCVLKLAALSSWTFFAAGQPIVYLVVALIVLALILWPRLAKASA